MPIEAAALTMQEVPLRKCPQCYATPFTPFMRGQVARSRWLSWEGWKATVLGLPFDYCAVICADCKNIVGWERPYDLEMLMQKYERRMAVKQMVREWKERQQ